MRLILENWRYNSFDSSGHRCYTSGAIEQEKPILYNGITKHLFAWTSWVKRLRVVFLVITINRKANQIIHKRWSNKPCEQQLFYDARAIVFYPTHIYEHNTRILRPETKSLQAPYIYIYTLFSGKRLSNRKETSCLPLLNADFEPIGSLKPNLQQTECPLTNRLSYRGSSLKLELLFSTMPADVLAPGGARISAATVLSTKQYFHSSWSGFQWFIGWPDDFIQNGQWDLPALRTLKHIEAETKWLPFPDEIFRCTSCHVPHIYMLY